MRYRDYKVFAKDQFYHVFNRGNNKLPIFIEENDYHHFLKRAKLVLGLSKDTQGPSLSKRNKLRIKALPEGAFDIVAYCLMSNHFHFLIRQNSEIPVDRFISKLCTSYSAYFKQKYNHIGHLFQGKFKAKPVENDTYLSYLSSYIHNNPQNPNKYRYSSLMDYAGKRNDNLVNKDFLLSIFDNNREQYIKFVTNFTTEDAQKIHDPHFS